MMRIFAAVALIWPILPLLLINLAQTVLMVNPKTTATAKLQDPRVFLV